MKQYISKKDLNYLSTITAEGSEAESLAFRIKKEIESVFSNSYVNVRFESGFEPSIYIAFAVGKDKSEWINGIMENDPLIHKILIWGVNKDGSLKDMLQTDLSTGGSIILKGSDETGYRSPRVKIGWRNMKGTPDKIVAGLKKYFIKAKETLKKYKDQVREDTYIKDKV